MPVSVVDVFEVIDIEHCDAHGFIGALRLSQFAAQGFLEEAAVVKPGERIADGLLTQLLLQHFNFFNLMQQFLVGLTQIAFDLLQMRDVAHDDQPSRRMLVLVKHRADGEIDVELGFPLMKCSKWSLVCRQSGAQCPARAAMRIRQFP